MTFGLKNVLGVWAVSRGEAPPSFVFFDYSRWPAHLRRAFDLLFTCHYSHALDFAVALLNFFVLWPATFPHAATPAWGWIGAVLAFNLVVNLSLYTAWHVVMYASPAATRLRPSYKLNPEEQYATDGDGGAALGLSSNLLREVTFTTLGIAQSSLWQCAMMWLWASGRVPFYADFWATPLYSIGHLLLVTYWRELHFYCVHRFMHPWWSADGGLANGDIGAFLYRHAHSLHHKSYNPGPFSGLSMHPLEHFFYFSCTLLPLLFTLHPLHFLYAKCHADIAPLAGHDGFLAPGGDSKYHYLHHAHFECNYGVPLVPADELFGTYLDYDVYKQHGGNFAAAKKAMARARAGGAASADARAPEEVAASASAAAHEKRA